jgi:hypothetical protein
MCNRVQPRVSFVLGQGGDTSSDMTSSDWEEKMDLDGKGEREQEWVLPALGGP